MEIKTHNEISSTVESVKNNDRKSSKQKVWIGTYLLLSVVCLTLHFLLRLKPFEFFGTYLDTLSKLTLAGFFSFIVLIFSRIVQGIMVAKIHERAVQYNIIRLIRLLSIVIIAFIIVSFNNENWYTAAVSLGLISLILGFALQSPIASLIGWFYIVIRAPYQVGDRIQVDAFTGDVVEINYFDTTLWEFAGEYITNDLPSGRLIRFPNSFVWQSGVYNYSWQEFPYIWNEIPFYIAYESDFAFVENTIRKVAKAELGDSMEERVDEMRSYLKETPVDELEIKEYPFVHLRINSNTWVEALLIYLVPPKKSSVIRTKLIKDVIAALLKEPERVMFPKGNSR